MRHCAVSVLLILHFGHPCWIGQNMLIILWSYPPLVFHLFNVLMVINLLCSRCTKGRHLVPQCGPSSSNTRRSGEELTSHCCNPSLVQQCCSGQYQMFLNSSLPDGTPSVVSYVGPLAHISDKLRQTGTTQCKCKEIESLQCVLSLLLGLLPDGHAQNTSQRRSASNLPRCLHHLNLECLVTPRVSADTPIRYPGNNFLGRLSIVISLYLPLEPNNSLKVLRVDLICKNVYIFFL